MGQLKMVEVPSDRLKKLRKESDNLSGFDKALLDSLLVEYDALAEFAGVLRKTIRQEGVMVDREVGTANNRHIENIANPALKPYESALGRMGDVAKKISDFAKRSDVESDEDDGFDSF